jgi:hypothetical protein
MPATHEIEAAGSAPDGQVSLQARHDRLQVLVGELLKKNQELRMRVALLERQAVDTDRGLAGASAWAALLLP